MKNFEEKIALEIDENRLGILVSAFRSASPQRLFARTNVNIAWPSFLRAQTFDREDQIA